MALPILLLLAVAPPRANAAQTKVVSMKNFLFLPATITISVGDTVEWRYDESSSDPEPNCESPYFRDPNPVTCPGHATTASQTGPDGKPLWDSGIHRASGFPFRVTFTKPGTYHYICPPHGGPNKSTPLTNMEGDITVNAASGDPNVLGRRQDRTLPNTGVDVALWLMIGCVVTASGIALRLAGRRLDASRLARTRTTFS